MYILEKSTNMNRNGNKMEKIKLMRCKVSSEGLDPCENDSLLPACMLVLFPWKCFILGGSVGITDGGMHVGA